MVHVFFKDLKMLPVYVDKLFWCGNRKSRTQTSVGRCFVKKRWVGLICKLPGKNLVGGLEPWNFMTFHILGIATPTDYIIFFRGVQTTNQKLINVFLFPFEHWPRQLQVGSCLKTLGRTWRFVSSICIMLVLLAWRGPSFGSQTLGDQSCFQRFEFKLVIFSGGFQDLLWLVAYLMHSSQVSLVTERPNVCTSVALLQPFTCIAKSAALKVSRTFWSLDRNSVKKTGRVGCDDVFGYCLCLSGGGKWSC